MADFGRFLDLEKVPHRLDEPLATHTTMRVGGRARYFIEPMTDAQLREALRGVRECGVPLYVLGGGANLLVADAGVDGAVLSLRRFDACAVSGTRLRAGAGHGIGSLVNKAAEAGISGLEAVIGIPGVVGGGLAMNCGGRHGDIGPRVVWARAYDREGAERRFTRDACGFRYRASRLAEFIVVEAEFEGVAGSPADIKARTREILDEKAATQPLGDRNAGCIFKNSPAGPAGQLIEQAGLKGLRIGQAEVSPKHANFIVNLGGATAADVLALAERVRQSIRERLGVELEMEIKRWP